MNTNNIALNTLESFFSGFFHILALGFLLGIALLVLIFHSYFGCDWWDAIQISLNSIKTNNKYLTAISCLSIALGLTLSSWLHTWLHLRARPRSNDKFSRGARVVNSDN
jgi:hypothetical protein